MNKLTSIFVGVLFSTFLLTSCGGKEEAAATTDATQGEASTDATKNEASTTDGTKNEAAGKAEDTAQK